MQSQHRNGDRKQPMHAKLEKSHQIMHS